MTEQEIKNNSSDELREKYPIGSRWVNEDGDVFMVTGHVSDNVNFQLCLDDAVGNYVYSHTDYNFKPYTEPKTKTVYVHWCSLTKKPYVLNAPDKCEDTLAIKKVTLTEGEFDE